jgi:hypothetical protein
MRRNTIINPYLIKENVEEMMSMPTSTGSSLMLEYGNYYIPIKLTKLTKEVQSPPSYEDRCVVCATPKREMSDYCPKCSKTTELVRVWLKEDTGSRDMWDFKEQGFQEAIKNLPRVDSWYVIEKHPKPKLTARDKMAMAQKSSDLTALFAELAESRSVLKCLFVFRSRGLLREAYILPSGYVLATSPKVQIKDEFALTEKTEQVLESVREMTLSVGEKVEAEKPTPSLIIPPDNAFIADMRSALPEAVRKKLGL